MLEAYILPLVPHRTADSFEWGTAEGSLTTFPGRTSSALYMIQASPCKIRVPRISAYPEILRRLERMLENKAYTVISSEYVVSVRNGTLSTKEAKWQESIARAVMG